MSRVVVVADGGVGEVRAGLLDDGGRREVQRRGRGTGTPWEKHTHTDIYAAPVKTMEEITLKEEQTTRRREIEEVGVGG